ncbi:MAG TPA: hypothetical protein PKK43_17795 [Spirochaetota bacterium]|nr:hypothetical protein [Spirochaetota bacterium]
MSDAARNPVSSYFSELRDYAFDVIYYSMKYYKTENKWPVTHEELIDFAGSDNYSLDLGKFYRIEFAGGSNGVMNITFGIRKEKLSTKTNVDTVGKVIIRIKNIGRLRFKDIKNQKIVINVSAGANPVDEEMRNGDYFIELWSKTDKRIKILNDGTVILRDEKWTYNFESTWISDTTNCNYPEGYLF